ncbi:hypothetical protein SLE2022_389500 [Rubroshorea leprosula]
MSTSKYLMWLIFVLLVCACLSESRILKSSMAEKRSLSKSMAALKQQLAIETMKSKSAAMPQRLSPGGPDPQHHK